MHSRPTIGVLRAVGTGLLLLLLSAVTGAAPASQTPPPATAPTKPILLTDPVPDPRQEGVIWFSATGHTLRGAFLLYWQQYGGLAQFGYPLTEEFFEPVGADNKPVQVQYFERNRFEHHPENQPPYDVLLGTLGRDFHPQDPPASQLPSPAIYFPETGHSLSGAFKQYWETHGGMFVHGYPITEAYQEQNPTDGKSYTVQYFERSRFELHSENAGSPYEVLLGLLGRQLSEKKGYPYGWYPAYGHAADWSWVSGEWIWPFRSCFQCQCHVVKYVQGGCYFCIYVNVKPVGSIWDPGGQGFGPRPISPDAIVIFGNLLDTGPQVHGEPCYAPAYQVNSVQASPAE